MGANGFQWDPMGADVFLPPHPHPRCPTALIAPSDLNAALPALPALPAEGALYAATANNFHGTEPIVSRSLGARTALKTDAFLRWLAGGERRPIALCVCVGSGAP